MKTLQQNKLWITVHILGIVPLLIFIGQAASSGFHLEMMAELVKETGEMTIRWLLFTLAITPLVTLFAWRKMLTVRKAAGLYAFAYGLLHLLFYAGEHDFGLSATWTAVFAEFRLLIGLLAVGIMVPLALTSNRWSMRWLGKNWKRLHRLTYFVGIFAVIHIALYEEGFVYIFILAVLLVLRIPRVRRRAASWRQKRRARQSIYSTD